MQGAHPGLLPGGWQHAISADHTQPLAGRDPVKIEKKVRPETIEARVRIWSLFNVDTWIVSRRRAQFIHVPSHARER